jgi:NDP-4-keto-2,6-dideoxyhexose 3-C-methyltransferase
MKYTTRESCRACGSRELLPLFSLGNHFVSDFVFKEEVLSGPQAPIDLELCRSCTLVQMKHTAPQELLYKRHYWYRSGVTKTMREALRNITRRIERDESLVPGDVVLDIGSNDGTLLRSYSVDGLIRVGVEPADNLVEEGGQGVNLIHDFWNCETYLERFGRLAKVITAIGMFYDLEDPNQFIGDIARALQIDGLFVAQLMCLKNMFNTNDVGNFCHEHLEYYSLLSLQKLFLKHNLQLVDIETNSVNGESYRLFVRRVDSTKPMAPGASQRLVDAFEADKQFHDPSFYQRFYERMEANKKRVVSFINQQVSQGKSVWVYGASTKGNTLLQYYGLSYPIIQGAAERSPEKWGKCTVGTGIPIYSEEYARSQRPDFFLVLPYAFLSEFVQREQDWLQSGGRFIVPLPEFRIAS